MLPSNNPLVKFPSETELIDPYDEVEARLFEKYKRAKAARLSGFWLHVERIGIDAAKMEYGKSSFYAAQADLKAAGVELPKANLKASGIGSTEPMEAVSTDNPFVRRFQLEIPSLYATSEEARNQDEEG